MLNQSKTDLLRTGLPKQLYKVINLSLSLSLIVHPDNLTRIRPVLVQSTNRNVAPALAHSKQDSNETQYF
jgi:hypothetical protein